MRVCAECAPDKAVITENSDDHMTVTNPQFPPPTCPTKVISPMQAHLTLKEQSDDPYSFVKYTRVIGKAYQCQAMELVKLSRLFLAALQVPQNDVLLQK